MDATLIVGALLVIVHSLDREWTPFFTLAAFLAALMFLLAGEARRLYASWRLGSVDEEFGTVVAIWGFTCCAFIVGAFLAKVSSSYSRLAIIVWFLVTPSLLLSSRLLARAALRLLRSSGRNSRTVAIVGAGSASKLLLGKIEESGGFGMKLVGVFDDRSLARIEAGGDDASTRAGDLDQLIDRSRRGEIDYVFITLPMRAEKRIIELVNRLADTTASVYVVPDLFVFDLMRARTTMLGGLPAVSVYESPFDGLSGWVKRAEDLVLGSALLALAALPMMFIAVALKLTSKGSVLFRQRRYGLNGSVVHIVKFRTMSVSEDGANVLQAQGPRDPRITPIGRFLRATSMDELPQLFNVLSGEMSLVGPRPHAIIINEEYRRLVHGYMLRHKVKPGITGWAQVNGWHGHDTVEKMKKRVEHDLEYLQSWSVWLDVKIIFLTIASVFSKKKAHQG
jgi:putative colanic acid biosynthesis UDP-glucose lipid carrier transferase